MFSHVMVGTNDLEASKKFYDAVLGTLGISPGFISSLYLPSPWVTERGWGQQWGQQP